MSTIHDEKIRLRAYELWEADGRPEGQHHRHWQDAYQELVNAPSDEEISTAVVEEPSINGAPPSETTASVKPKAVSRAKRPSKK